MQEIKKCPLCNSSELEGFYEGIDMYFSKRRVRFVICKNCSLVFLNPRPNREEYEEMYKTIFQDKRRNLNTVQEVVDKLIKKDSYKRKTKELLYFKDFINKDSNCLEIGCGWGALARVIKDNFRCKIKVVEPSLLASKVAEEYYNLDVYNGSFEDFIKDNKEKYDFIFMYHVFEHILDPNIFLEDIKKILNNNGKLLLALPNILEPDQPSSKFFHIEHCFYYTPITLKYILEKHGFKIVKFWNCRTDMKVVCAFDKGIHRKNFINNEYEEIQKAIKMYDFRYKVLRFCKKIICYFVDDNKKNKVVSFLAKILKKLGIIKS